MWMGFNSVYALGISSKNCGPKGWCHMFELLFDKNVEQLAMLDMLQMQNGLVGAWV